MPPEIRQVINLIKGVDQDGKGKEVHSAKDLKKELDKAYKKAGQLKGIFYQKYWKATDQGGEEANNHAGGKSR